MVRHDRVTSTREAGWTYGRGRQVDGGAAALLGADAGVPADGEAAAGRAPGTGRAAGRYPDLGRHKGVVGEPAVGEGVLDAQEVAVRRGGRGPEPPAA